MEKDDFSTSSLQKFIIPRLPRFDKLDMSQFKLYIETETMTRCFASCNHQTTILIRSAEGEKNGFGILCTLRIYTGLRKLSKTNIYDLHQKKRISISYQLTMNFDCKE